MGWSLHKDTTVLTHVKILAINFTGLDWLKWESTGSNLNENSFQKWLHFQNLFMCYKMLFYAVTISSNM